MLLLSSTSKTNKAKGKNGMSMPCKYCKVDTHSSFTCFKRPKKRMQAKKGIKKIGKMGKAYIELRKQFFIDNPGPHFCYYCMYLGIERELDEEDTQVEHYYSKAHHPEMRLDQSNLVKSCDYHNKLKGSVDGPDFIELLRETERGLTS